MKLIVLLLAWGMLKVVHHRYTISHPTGILYRDISDFITAFMYQPFVNVMLIFFIFIALGIIYLVLYLEIDSFVGRKLSSKWLAALHVSSSLYLIIMGFIYFTFISILYILIFSYAIFQYFSRLNKRKLRRMSHY